MSPVLRFITKQRCSLCEEAGPRILSAAGKLGVDVQVVDVDTDPQLLEAFGSRVPVLLNARDRVLAEGRIGTGSAWLAALRVRVG